MSRTTCEYCHTRADASAGKCPHCGATLRTSLSPTAKAIAVTAAVLLIAGGAIMVVLNGDPATPSDGTTVVDPTPTLPEDGQQ